MRCGKRGLRDERFDVNLQTLSPQLSRNFPHHLKAPQRSKMLERRRERTNKFELFPPQKLHNHHKFPRGNAFNISLHVMSLHIPTNYNRFKLITNN